jgi:hypothetical protein
MEFINQPLLAWCLEGTSRRVGAGPIARTTIVSLNRKNYDAVRKTVGYFRFDSQTEQEALAEVYRYLCPLYNYWYPSFRLVDKVKQADGRYKKVYEKAPVTPYQRLLGSPLVSDASKTELMRRKGEQNPVTLNNGLNGAMERLLKINQEKTSMKPAPLKEAEQAQAV